MSLADFPKRLKKKMDEYKFTQQSFADAVGITQPSLNETLGGQTKIPRNIERFAQVLRVNPGWLLFGEGNEDPYIKIPKISWEQLKLLNNGKLELKSEDKEMFPGIHEGCFTLTVKDDQMSAPVGSKYSFPEGTIIVVDPSKEYKSGDCVIVRLKNSDDYFFKQYIYDTGKHLFKSLNPNYNVTIEMTDDMEIMGVVVGGYQPSRDFR
jgi:SOS-response transcriptional repressor LexA